MGTGTFLDRRKENKTKAKAFEHSEKIEKVRFLALLGTLPIPTDTSRNNEHPWRVTSF